MTISYHERPGVYSEYEASSVYSGMRSGKTVGLAAQSTATTELRTLHSTAEAAEFSEDTVLFNMLKLLFRNGAGKVLLCPVAVNSVAAYETAMQRLLDRHEAQILLTDSEEAIMGLSLKRKIETASQDRNECIAVVGCAAQTDGARITQAAALNSARVLLAAPMSACEGQTQLRAGYTAAALAGLIAGQTDPALPISGASLSGLAAVDTVWSESELDELIRGGVTPVEYVDGQVRIVRGVSSKTTENGVADTTWKPITTILIVDDVITGVRASLQRRFRRAKNNAATRSAIRDQVVMELENRLRRQIIDAYDEIRVEANGEDPTVCDVIFSFGISHGLNRILLSAHITL